jgi:sulfur carrier protein
MKVTVNGEPREIPAGTSLAQLTRQVTDQQTGIAVAVNGEVVSRRGWPTTPLADHDAIEIVTAVQGG